MLPAERVLIIVVNVSAWRCGTSLVIRSELSLVVLPFLPGCLGPKVSSCLAQAACPPGDPPLAVD